jgi:hypothetical protein
VDSLKVVYPSILVTLGLATIPVILETKIADIYVIYITLQQLIFYAVN